jgi:meso-butanediol dehydrogenase/(S,S)-butanediol dehydrogenase/diacetyl reductase
MNQLDGKVAVITGGASGIGLVTAKCFVEAGAEVVIGDVQDGVAVARELGASFVKTDVRDPDAVEALVRSAVAGHGRLDVLFNNAGIEFHGPLAATDPDDHRRMVDINLNGAYYGLQSAIRAMLDNAGPQRGSIINTASVAGLVGCPGLSTYNATKAGLVMLTRNAALEYGPFGIRVNAVCPGIIRTPMAAQSVAELGGADYLEGLGSKIHPLGRLGEPEDVARLVRFLASDDSSFISGAAIPIDGGMTAGFSATPGWEPSGG